MYWSASRMTTRSPDLQRGSRRACHGPWRRPLGTRLPGGHCSRGLRDECGEISLSKPSKMSCQRQAATVEERRDVGRAVVCRWIEAHCSPLAWLSRCWSAGRHRRTGTSGTLLGPVGVNTLPARRLPPPFGGISSRSCRQYHAWPPPGFRRGRPKTSSICRPSGSTL